MNNTNRLSIIKNISKKIELEKIKKDSNETLANIIDNDYIIIKKVREPQIKPLNF